MNCELSDADLKFIRSMSVNAYVAGSSVRRAVELLHRLANKYEQRQFIEATEHMLRKAP